MHFSCLRYGGSKSKVSPILAQLIPSGTTEMFSPFVGGASFELYCSNLLGMNVHASDIFEPVINFWNAAKYYQQELADLVQSHFFPISKPEFYYLRDHMVYDSGRDILERAAAYFAVNKASFSGLATSGGYSGRFYKQSCIDKLANMDLSNIDFDCCDFATAIERQPMNTLCFSDAPYALEGNKNNLYGRHGDTHANFDHERLFRCIQTRPFIMTYNDCPYIRDLYQNFRIYEMQMMYSMGRGAHKAQELVILGNI